VSGGLAPAIGLDLLQRIEAHAVQAWPPEILEVRDDGWVLRATPGLGRGRSNHALTPPRAVGSAVEDAGDDLDVVLAPVFEFAGRHGIEPGIQISPLHLQRDFVHELEARGWRVGPTVLVMVREGRLVDLRACGLEIVVDDHASADWLAAWSVCEPGRDDVDAHADTVFESLRSRARFARHEQRAVGISIESDGLAFLCCVAVAPELRGAGLGTAFVGELIGSSDADVTYLQTWESNLAARALYSRLGFREAYEYCHCVAPSDG
jgi:ribosomal protein S18 acetylase RimI-like enzyme